MFKKTLGEGPEKNEDAATRWAEGLIASMPMDIRLPEGSKAWDFAKAVTIRSILHHYKEVFGTSSNENYVRDRKEMGMLGTFDACQIGELSKLRLAGIVKQDFQGFSPDEPLEKTLQTARRTEPAAMSASQESPTATPLPQTAS